MKNPLLIIALSLVTINLQSQDIDDSLLADNTPNFQITVKKYEMVQTEIRTLENELVFTDTKVNFRGEKSALIELDDLQLEPGLKVPKKNPDTNILTSSPVRKKLLVAGDITPNYDLKKEVLPTNYYLTAAPLAKNVELGDSKISNPITMPNLAVLSLPENRSLSELPGYVPVARVGFSWKK